MDLTKIVKNSEPVSIKCDNSYMVEKSAYDVKETEYELFSEQYLEKPVISGNQEMAISPTACSIKGVPVIDDF